MNHEDIAPNPHIALPAPPFQNALAQHVLDAIIETLRVHERFQEAVREGRLPELKTTGIVFPYHPQNTASNTLTVQYTPGDPDDAIAELFETEGPIHDTLLCELYRRGLYIEESWPAMGSETAYDITVYVYKELDLYPGSEHYENQLEIIRGLTQHLHTYDLVVGNLGYVQRGMHLLEFAMSEYADYVKVVQSPGRAYLEPVTLFEDGEILEEFHPPTGGIN